MIQDDKLCKTCMFYDEKHGWCDKKNDGSHPDFYCDDWKAKVKKDE